MAWYGFFEVHALLDKPKESGVFGRLLVLGSVVVRDLYASSIWLDNQVDLRIVAHTMNPGCTSAR